MKGPMSEVNKDEQNGAEGCRNVQKCWGPTPLIGHHLTRPRYARLAARETRARYEEDTAPETTAEKIMSGMCEVVRESREYSSRYGGRDVKRDVRRQKTGSDVTRLMAVMASLEFPPPGE